MRRSDLIAKLASRILAVERPHPVRVGIDGVDAAGKTTLADELAPRLEAAGRQVVRASVDCFHNPSGVRYRRGRESPEGYYRDSFDHAAIAECLLQPLGPHGDRRFRRAAVLQEAAILLRLQPAGRFSAPGSLPISSSGRWISCGM